MDAARKSLYLDGPNDVDWIFQNDILREREESIYVDYVDYSDANRRERSWQCPNPRLMAIGLWNQRPKVLNVALALHGIGVTRSAALNIVAEIWRATTMDDSVKWKDIAALNLKTLQALGKAGLLRNRPEANFQMAPYDWLFPLYRLRLMTGGRQRRRSAPSPEELVPGVVTERIGWQAENSSKTPFATHLVATLETAYRKRG